MESVWDKLSAVQSRLHYLSQKQLRIYSARCKQIHEGSTGPSETFSDQVREVANELHDLWEEKRYLLSLLNVPEELSWMGVDIPSSADSPGPLQMSKKGLGTSPSR